MKMINLFKSGFFTTPKRGKSLQMCPQNDNHVNVTNTNLQNGVGILRQCLLHVLG